MKVIHVETGMHLHGGALQVAYIVEGLARRGVDNVVVCPPGAAVGQHLGDGHFARIHEIPCSGDADLRFLLGLIRLIRSERPDVVHLHSRRGADVLGGIAARWTGVPAVLSRRVDNPDRHWWTPLKYRLYTRVITISQGIAEVLKSEGLAPDKIRVVRSSVDPAPWQAPAPRTDYCREFDVAPDVLLVGVIAQLIERKGHAVLLDALALMGERRPRMGIVFFGRGPLRESLQKDIEARGFGGFIRIAGFRDDLERWLGCLDLVVHPALMEGLGVSLLQTSAAGVPIIACRAGGMPEAVRDGENGLIVTPGNARELADAVLRVAADAPLRRRMGEAGRRLIAREFSTDAMAAGNLAVYQDIIGA